MTFDELGDGIWRRRFPSLDLNVGVVEGTDGLLVVDTRASHGQADELIGELATLSPKPVRWVVNTHWHWDHTFGNARFPGAEIWGHDRCRAALLDRGDAMKDGAKRWLPTEFHPVIDDVEIVPPVHTFAERASLAIGRDVGLEFHGLGHTDADVVVRVDGVIFMGDLVEEGAPPAFADAHPLAWPATLGAVPLEEVVVPGHGDVVDRAFVDTQHQELLAVADLCRRVAAGDLSSEVAAASGPYPDEVMRSALARR